MNSQAWPQVVYQCMMAQWPQFAASVVNEAMALMQAGNPQPGGPMMQHAHAVTRREHHAALREASAIFLETLKIPDLPPNSTKYMIALNPDDDQIVANGVAFSRRHFARNFQQFSSDLQAYYNQTYGFVSVDGKLEDEGLLLSFALDTGS